MGSEGKNNKSLFRGIKCASRGGTEGHPEGFAKMPQPLKEAPEGSQLRQRRSAPRGLGSPHSQGGTPQPGRSPGPRGAFPGSSTARACCSEPQTPQGWEPHVPETPAQGPGVNWASTQGRPGSPQSSDSTVANGDFSPASVDW